VFLGRSSRLRRQAPEVANPRGGRGGCSLFWVRWTIRLAQDKKRAPSVDLEALQAEQGVSDEAEACVSVDLLQDFGAVASPTPEKKEAVSVGKEDVFVSKDGVSASSLGPPMPAFPALSVSAKTDVDIAQMEENLESGKVDELRIIVQHREEQALELMRIMSEVESGVPNLVGQEEHRDAVRFLGHQQRNLR